jgi:hypothetical protein
MHAVGDVIDRHLTLGPVWEQGLEDAPGERFLLRRFHFGGRKKALFPSGSPPF